MYLLRFLQQGGVAVALAMVLCCCALPDKNIVVEKVNVPNDKLGTIFEHKDTSKFGAEQNSTNPTTDRTELYIGASISIVGNMCISFALNIQKAAHNRIEELDSADPNYVKSPLWLLGIGLMIFGEIGNFAAYMFAPPAVVAPLGTVTVISNAIIAPCCLKEKARMRDAVGVMIAVIGAIVVVVYAPQAEDSLSTEKFYEHLKQPVFIAYASCLIFTGLIAFWLLKRGLGRKYVLVPLYVTAVLGSFTVLSVKATSMLLRETFGGNNEFKQPVIYVAIAILVFTAITQVRFLNYAMMHFDATVVVPCFFVMFTIGAILVGGVFYKDFDSPSNTWKKVFLFCFGCLCTFIGVYIITSGRRDNKVPELIRDHRSGEGARLLSEDYGNHTRDRSASNVSISAITPLAGVETTPLTRRKVRVDPERLLPGSDSEPDVLLPISDSHINFKLQVSSSTSSHVQEEDV
eukprot:m.337011 g.337011  ORF g.337011 m.337011 type:complete len:461 (-) comp18022_c0_seq1:180-1562(-)